MLMQVKLLSRNVESYHGHAPVSKSGSTIKYGPYTKIAPFTGGTISAHFENNSPFLDALELTREIEVSHWGNVYVEEWYTVKHMGAQHKVSSYCSSTSVIYIISAALYCHLISAMLLIEGPLAGHSLPKAKDGYVQCSF